jgi:hypothetical protein
MPEIYGSLLSFKVIQEVEELILERLQELMSALLSELLKK